MPLKSLFGCTITLCTKLRLYNAFVSVLLHGAETWTLLSAEIRRTETWGIQHVMPATYTRNPLVRLRHQCHHHKPDWPRKCSWQDHETTSCDVWSHKMTSRSHSGPHGIASGCQGKNWSPPRQQAAVETSTWPASPSIDATTGSRHRTRRWCRMGHSQWSSSMEGTTTHRRSSGGAMNEWMNC